MRYKVWSARDFDELSASGDTIWSSGEGGGPIVKLPQSFGDDLRLAAAAEQAGAVLRSGGEGGESGGGGGGGGA
jgi:hypothetical protein